MPLRLVQSRPASSLVSRYPKRDFAAVTNTYKFIRNRALPEKAGKWTVCLQSCLCLPSPTPTLVIHFIICEILMLFGLVSMWWVWISYHSRIRRTTLPSPLKWIGSENNSQFWASWSIRCAVTVTQPLGLLPPELFVHSLCRPCFWSLLLSYSWGSLCFLLV